MKRKEIMTLSIAYPYTVDGERKPFKHDLCSNTLELGAAAEGLRTTAQYLALLLPRYSVRKVVCMLHQ
jgi:hypothetical protein